MFILNFGIVFVLSIIFAYLVQHRVKKFDYPTRMTTTNNIDGGENQEMLPSPNPGQNPREVRECLGHFSTFFIYVVHLLVARIIPLLVFAIWIFYQAHFPKNFPCPLGPEMQGKGTSNNNVTLNSRNNLTFINCINPIGGKSKTLVYFVATVDVCLVTLSFLELGYIAWLAFNDRDFMNDQEFCTVYLLRKRKRIRKFVNKIRERFNGEEVFRLTDDFGGTKISSRPLKDIYVNVVIEEERELMNAYPREFKRHEIYQSHFKAPSKATELTSTVDIFKPKKGEQNQTYPRTILVIGRAGIGKTMLTRKLLHQWKGKEDEFWDGKIVILLQFRTFNNMTVTLREMFGFAKGLSSDDFETVYNFILSNPTNIVILFDGLDEVNVGDEISCRNREAVNSLNEKMPVVSIFKMLVHGRLLRGVTILTTTRPSAQHLFPDLNFERTVEVLGFFEDQIKEYVLKFCDNESIMSNRIWNQIQGSAEMRSLCYIPVNSYIVCLTLKESFENDESWSQLHESLNRNILGTITELYKRAVKVLLYRHHPKYRSQTRPSDYLIIPFPKELEKDLMKLKEIAKKGICDGQLIFERTSRDEFGDLANCGLFTKLPDKQRNLFCFLHLTLQEFFAASKVVDDMNKVVQFLDHHVKDPKWHLVIQFVAGLVGDKIREDPKGYKSQKVLADIQKRYYIFRIVYSILLQI
jgi:GTPase SAR1 family protein